MKKGGKKIRIIFNPDSGVEKIILNILETNGIKETIDSIYERAKQGKLSYSRILSNITKKLASGEITKQNLLLSVKQQMEIPENVAKNLAEEIKTKLIPITMKVPADGEREQERTSSPPFKKPTFSKNKNDIFIPPKRRSINNFQRDKTRQQNDDKIIKENQVNQKLKSDKPDKYREPI